jgi:hypothetical protein
MTVWAAKGAALGRAARYVSLRGSFGGFGFFVRHARPAHACPAAPPIWPMGLLRACLDGALGAGTPAAEPARSEKVALLRPDGHPAADLEEQSTSGRPAAGAAAHSPTYGIVIYAVSTLCVTLMSTQAKVLGEWGGRRAKELLFGTSTTCVSLRFFGPHVQFLCGAHAGWGGCGVGGAAPALKGG